MAHWSAWRLSGVPIPSIVVICENSGTFFQRVMQERTTLPLSIYVADAALAAVAAALRPRHFELVAEHRQKRYVGLADYAFRHSVDDQVLDMIAGLGRNCDFLRHICSPLS